MPICENCKSSFPIKIKVDGKERNLCSRKYCLTCSPFSLHNTKKLNNIISTSYCIKHKCQKQIKRYDRPNGYICGKCNSEKVQKRRDKVKQMALEYKGGKCQICSYNKCAAALTFHHLDPSQKDFGISDKGYTRAWEKVKAELDKCILLCQNCHAEVHAGISTI